MPSKDELVELLHAEMARLVKSMAPNDFAVEQALDDVSQAAVSLIDDVNCADILIIEDGNFRSMAPTSEQAAIRARPMFGGGCNGLDSAVPRPTR